VNGYRRYFNSLVVVIANAPERSDKVLLGCSEAIFWFCARTAPSDYFPSSPIFSIEKTTRRQENNQKACFGVSVAVIASRAKQSLSGYYLCG